MVINVKRVTSPELALEAARVTRGTPHTSGDMPSMKLWRSLLTTKHSPIRSVIYRIEAAIPYYVHVHLLRHTVAIMNWYVQSQRLLGDETRGSLRQGREVRVIFDVNAEGLITLGEKRLCLRAAESTRRIIGQIRDCLAEGDKYDQAVAEEMRPPCDRCREGGCEI